MTPIVPTHPPNIQKGPRPLETPRFKLKGDSNLQYLYKSYKIEIVMVQYMQPRVRSKIPNPAVVQLEFWGLGLFSDTI